MGFWPTLHVDIQNVDLQINTWAFPYWPGYHPETPILARDKSRGDNQANMEMPMY
jgi:hypothetical protein